MRLVTLRDGSPDGQLVVVATDGLTALSAGPMWPNLLSAIERWDEAEIALRELARRVDDEGQPIDSSVLGARYRGRGSG